MKQISSILCAILMLSFGILACNLPSKDQVNAAATVIALTFEAQTAQAPKTQPPTAFMQVASPIAPSAIPLPTQILPSPTPAGTYFVTSTGANCRSGPSTAYSILTAIPAGTYIILVGRTNDNSWWYVQVNPSLDCWISGVTGYTTGNPGSMPIVAAPPLPTAPPTAVSAPTFSDVVALTNPVYYYNNGCGSNQVQIGARIHDQSGTGIAEAHIKYHYQKNGYTGPDQIQNVTDQAMGGQYGFSFYTDSSLSGDNGNIVYEVFAKDNAGNASSSGQYHLQVKYCP